MKFRNISIMKIFAGLLALVLISGIQITSIAQITTYQYRHVPDDKIAEFIKRETTYWSKVAQKAIDNKKMTFWALLEKVDGYDLPNSSNFLFVNTFPNIDSAGDMWGTAESVAGVKMEQMETNSLSTTTSQIYLHDEDWAQATSAVPEKDFNYVVMNYHNSSAPDSFIRLEKKYWKPFIQIAMNKKQTKQVAWGNAIVLSPSGDNIKFNTVSYDLFPTLQDALLTPWDPKTVFPTKGLGMLDKIRTNVTGRNVFRVVKVVSSN
jgi:predicted DNA-binding ribbon-helix-helix protein